LIRNIRFFILLLFIVIGSLFAKEFADNTLMIGKIGSVADKAYLFLRKDGNMAGVYYDQATNKVGFRNLSTDVFTPFDSLAVSAFTSLTDTPSSYSGQAGKVVAVNSGATALEFIEKPWIPCIGENVAGSSTLSGGTFNDVSLSENGASNCAGQNISFTSGNMVPSVSGNYYIRIKGVVRTGGLFTVSLRTGTTQILNWSGTDSGVGASDNGTAEKVVNLTASTQYSLDVYCTSSCTFGNATGGAATSQRAFVSIWYAD